VSGKQRPRIGRVEPLPRSLLVACCSLLTVSCSPPPVAMPLPASRSHLEHARRLLREVPLVDGHNDLPWAIREDSVHPGDVEAYDLRQSTRGHTDLDRLARGQVGAQFWSVYVPGDWADGRFARVQLEQIDIARRVIARYPERLALALTAADVEREFARGRIASLLGAEGGHVLENSLGALRAYYDLGVRYLTLTHNVTLPWADAALDSARSHGLSPFGREVVREMNRLGMLIDLSHVSPAVMSQALDLSEAPVIFSHSSARALVDHPRNVPDSILERMPANGGVVMVTFVPAFVSTEVAAWDAMKREHEGRIAREVADTAERVRRLAEWERRHPAPAATLAQVADHLDHVHRVAGADHVGIGSDFDGISYVPRGLEDVSRFPDLFAELIRRGWSDEDLRKVAGGNLLRALRGAEQAAVRLQRERRTPAASSDGSGG
jgi:membrane dipeptidase